MPRQKKLIEESEEEVYEDVDYAEEYEAEPIETGPPEIEDLLNDVAFRNKPIDDEVYQKLIPILKHDLGRRGRFARLFRHSVRHGFVLLGITLPEHAFVSLERDPASFKAQHLDPFDVTKSAFVDLCATFALCKQFYERAIIVLSKICEYQENQIKMLKEKLGEQEEFL